jgi:hypothetical protein
MNGSTVSGPDRIIVKPVRPLADVRYRPNTPEPQTPEPVDVGEHGRELASKTPAVTSAASSARCATA